MLFSVLKRFLIFPLLLANVFILSGCNGQNTTWVNTNSMPGHTFKKYTAYVQHNTNNKDSSSDFGPAPIEKNIQFGPRDISFDFKKLNR